MHLIEIRELEGPNPYLSVPAIKVEFDLDDSEPNPDWTSRLQNLLGPLSTSAMLEPGDDDGRHVVARCMVAAVQVAHAMAGLAPVDVATVEGDIETRIVVAFAWDRRPVALAVARLAADATSQAVGHGALDQARVDSLIESLRRAVAATVGPDDSPELIRVGDGPPHLVSITGTNGKTTTTRLVAHLLDRAGRSVGWSSTSGVYLRGREIESGDWSGPAGARLLIHRDELDWAILETARGGILRRGLAYDQAHVTAMTNVSADHLGDYGVLTIRTLAKVKGTVVRATRPDGWAILNADDPLVFEQRAGIDAQICFLTQQPPTAELHNHLDGGGRVVAVQDGMITLWEGVEATPIIAVRDVPLTFGGVARHMVENVLCAVGIALGCGLGNEEIASGLRAFTSSPALNPGRLNVYQVRGATYVADYAHNEAGLAELINLARTLVRGDGRLWLIIGTAGDRPDETFRSLGRMSARASDHVILKDMQSYLRGRSPGEMQRLMDEGVRAAGGRSLALVSDEISAIDLALAAIRPGDVVAVMATDQPGAVADHLEALANQPDPTS